MDVTGIILTRPLAWTRIDKSEIGKFWIKPVTKELYFDGSDHVKHIQNCDQFRIDLCGLGDVNKEMIKNAMKDSIIAIGVEHKQERFVDWYYIYSPAPRVQEKGERDLTILAWRDTDRWGFETPAQLPAGFP